MLVQLAFNNLNNPEQIVGLPGFVQTARFDINAIVPTDGLPGPTDPATLAPMMLSLLKERFKLSYHTEERPVMAYSLVQSGPKMKKADPERRTSCKSPPPSLGAPSASRVLTCQNITMGQFVEYLQGTAPELAWPVADATGLAGAWDFTLTFSGFVPPPPVAGVGGAGRGGPPGAGDLLGAADPTGVITIFDAIERQLGLRLERQKRLMPVIVIDHLEEKPTEN
jgi:uncharacterized protein (TIGR03435 family)